MDLPACEGCRQRDRELEQLRVRVRQLEGKLDDVTALVEVLREKAGINSRNSSLPPSTDRPDAPKKESKEPSGRRSGGQPGHPIHKRELLPVAQVDDFVTCKAMGCRKCGALLLGDDPCPECHQVLDLRDFRAVLTQYEIHTLICLNCGEATTGSLPPGVPHTAYGPRLLALVAVLTGVYRLSKRLAVRLLQDVLGVQMSLGALSNCERKVSGAVTQTVEEARDFARQQPVKSADETTWKEGKKRAKVWLWVLCTAQVTVFMIRPSRATEAAKELLGAQLGILITDRLGSYAWWQALSRQLCWAHIKRHFKRFVDAGGEAARIGEALQAERRKLFRWWSRVKDGTLARHRFRQYVAPVRKRIRLLLEQGAACSHAKTAGTCAELLKLEPALWTFVRHEGVEPTNNCSEQRLRTAVIWRKLSFGTHSCAGSRFVEQMLSISVTLRQQGRNILDFVAAAVTASLKGLRGPSLLPAAGIA